MSWAPCISSKPAAAETPCAVVNVTSDKCYENREWVWGYREDEPMGGRDPYSNSKGCAELVTTRLPRVLLSTRSRSTDHGVALGQRSRRQRYRRRRLDQQSAHPRPHAGLSCRPALSDPKSLRVSGHGSSFWSRCADISCLRSDSPRTAARFASGWNFGPADSDAKPVSWIADELVRLWGSAAVVELAMPPRIRTKPIPQAGRCPKPRAVWIGGRCFR